MSIKTDALMIRVTKVGEADRFVTALTRDLGLVRASAKGAQKAKSKNNAATSLLAYSKITLIESHEKYVITEAQPERLFYSFGSDISSLALAQYFCEIAGVLCPWDEPAEFSLRLLLNSLHFLTEGQKDPRLLKAVTELRLLAEAGYMPNLTACAACGEDSSPLYFSPVKGTLLCEQCTPPSGDICLAPATLEAMRHILSCPLEKIFQFSVSDDVLAQLAHVTESFLLCQLIRGFKTLDFYHSIH